MCDPSRPASDADAVIAYVEQRRDGAFEVVWLCGSAGMEVFATLAEAESAVSHRYAAARRATTPASTKPTPIAHRPPLSPA
ncbi:MAG: hypothetical protein PGN24_10105 [Microbacterium arborescens]